MLDCDRIYSLVVDLVLARIRGVPFDLREKVEAMGSPRAVNGGGGGWAGISLDVLRSTHVSYQATERRRRYGPPRWRSGAARPAPSMTTRTRYALLMPRARRTACATRPLPRSRRSR